MNLAGVVSCEEPSRWRELESLTSLQDVQSRNVKTSHLPDSRLERRGLDALALNTLIRLRCREIFVFFRFSLWPLDEDAVDPVAFAHSKGYCQFGLR